MSSLARQIKRLTEQLGEAHEADADARRQLLAIERERDKLMVQVAELRAQAVDLIGQRDAEKVTRVAAQRGLVAYMREHGLGDRIGYDPDQDPVIIEGIKQGVLPPPGFSRQQLREAIRVT